MRIPGESKQQHESNGEMLILIPVKEKHSSRRAAGFLSNDCNDAEPKGL